MASIVPIYEVLAGDTPNEGRIKWNASITSLLADRTNYARVDSSLVDNLNFNSFRAVYLGDGIADTDGVNLGQLKSYANKAFNQNTIYVHTYLPNGYTENIYNDSSALVAIRCQTLDLAVSSVPSDSTTKLRGWTIVVPGETHDMLADNLGGKFISIVGIGDPIINLSSNLSVTTIDLNTKGVVAGTRLYATQGSDSPVTLIVREGTYKDNIIFSDILVDSSNFATISIKGANIIDCDLVADYVQMDSTTNGMVDNCRMSVDLGNWENNVEQATNKVVSSLATLYNL